MKAILRHSVTPIQERARTSDYGGAALPRYASGAGAAADNHLVERFEETAGTQTAMETRTPKLTFLPLLA